LLENKKKNTRPISSPSTLVRALPLLVLYQHPTMAPPWPAADGVPFLPHRRPPIPPLDPTGSLQHTPPRPRVPHVAGRAKHRHLTRPKIPTDAALFPVGLVLHTSTLIPPPAGRHRPCPSTGLSPAFFPARLGFPPRVSCLRPYPRVWPAAVAPSRQDGLLAMGSVGATSSNSSGAARCWIR
jgi:hypothetical protein